MDLLYPPWIRTSSAKFDFISQTASARSIFTGTVRTADRSGDRVRVSVTTSNATDKSTAERAILKSIYGSLRGQTNRIWIADPTYKARGSFPDSELLTNNTFGNGTSGWGTNGTNVALSVQDRVMRVTLTDKPVFPQVAQALSGVTQYTPLVARVLAVPGRPPSGSSAGPTCTLQLHDGSLFTNSTSTVNGASSMLTSSAVVTTTTPTVIFYAEYSSSGLMAGDYFETPWVSMSRCALVDNGPNLLTYSDQLDDASWTKFRATVGVNATTAPDGTSTADSVIEDATASNSHGIQRANQAIPSIAADYCIGGAFKAGNRNFVALQFVEKTASTSCTAWFNLNTGAVGSIVNQANVSNGRAFISSLGNGWYFCSLVCRKTNAATAADINVYACNADGSITYTGTSVTSTYAWRISLAPSSVPVRLVQTTTTATTGSSQSGDGIYLKGLPPSTNGLLLPGDWVQLNTELNMVRSSLNSDGAGIGYLQLRCPLRKDTADNDALIVTQPMGRFVATDNTTGWDDNPGVISSFTREFEEALDL